MALTDLLGRIATLFTHRDRRVWGTQGRVHVEMRRIEHDEVREFRARLHEVVREHPRIQWVEVLPTVRRIIVAFETGAYTVEEVVALVEEAERAARLQAAPFGDDRREHPADGEPALRALVELTGDAWGLVVGAGLKLTPLPGVPFAGNVAALLSLLKGSDRLRQGLDERYGPHTVDLFLNLAVAGAQGAAQRPLSSLVDVSLRVAALREALARRAVWHEREPELAGARPAAESGDHRVEPRPTPLPAGPIEEYADRAWVVSLAGFGLSFLTTRSFQRATAALYGAIPKPARLGREVFSSGLCRALGARGIVTLDAAALRRLDRVDCLVLQGDLVPRQRFLVADVIVAKGANGDVARARASELLDPEAPLDIRHAGGWTLGPVRRLEAILDPSLANRVAELGNRGAIVLGLAHEGSMQALVDVEVTPQTGVAEIVKAAHDAQMHVVVATNDETALEGIEADDIVPGGAAVVRGIRRLQREGRVVAFVGTGGSPGLPVADVGFGLCRVGDPTPWGAHFLLRHDLSDVHFLLEACAAARKIAKQSVNIALAAATAGALVSAGGLLPMSSTRVLFVVNGAALISMANGARGSYQIATRSLPAPRDPTPWHALEADGVLARLGVTRDGLPGHDVALRRQRRAARPSALGELSSAITDELFNPLAPLLAAGAGLSAAIGSMADAVMVGGVVGLNAIVGGVQRFSNERAVRALAQESRRPARVVRGGASRTVDAEDLVRGDLVELDAGDVVPADCRIIEATSLEVDASSLTGESLPVKKGVAASFEGNIADRSSMLYEGTSLAAGRARAVVVAVGTATEARRTSNVARTERQGGVEQRLRTLMTLTAPVALGAGVGVVAAGLVRGRKLSEVVGSGVSLAVAAVPEGLPPLATAAQLSAAKRLAVRGALVKHARSVEALGRVDIVCLDKTGTLTKGRIALTVVSDGQHEAGVGDLGPTHLRVLAAGLRAGAHTRVARRAEPMDAALHRRARKLGLGPDHGAHQWRRTSEIAFEAGRGYHAVLGGVGDGALLSIKGAPEVVLASCSAWWPGGARAPLDADRREALRAEADRLARKGLRVVAVAERQDTGVASIDPSRLRGMEFLGFLAFRDPVRKTARAALDGLRRAGVSAVMITGDHPSTAQAIAEELDLLRGRKVMTGADLALSTEEELDASILGVGVFARVTPTQKVRVVRALQRAGRVVAMAGDGANDAPAIRLADVGIAIGERSTAAARGAADVVLTDERIETLVDALVEGRAMWASVREALAILIGGNLGEIGYTLAAGLVDGRPPLNARQLLLVNLLTDVAPAMAIALRPPSVETLDQLAREGPDASLAAPLNRAILWRATMTGAGAGGAWIVGKLTGGDARARTIGLAALVGTQLGQTLVSGGASRPVIVTSLGSMALLFSVISTPGVSHFFGCRPMGPLAWSTALGAAGLATYASVRLPGTAERWTEALRTRLAAAGYTGVVEPAERLTGPG